MGGKGGPLAFLNKKPWHPLNLRNQEEIWKREQAYLAELEKRDQLVKQIEEEREQEDNVTQFQRHKLGDQRVEWMYQGGFAAQEDAEKRQEEYLLGKTVDKLPEQAGQEEAAARVDEVAQGASIAQPRAVDFTANETWSRLNADPMLMMKKRQLDKQKEIQEKIKMIRLQAKIQKKASAKVSGVTKKEKSHKKDKKHKKEKREKRHKSSKRRHSSTDSQSPSASRSPPPRSHENDLRQPRARAGSGERHHGAAERLPGPPAMPRRDAGDRGRNSTRDHDVAAAGPGDRGRNGAREHDVAAEGPSGHGRDRRAGAHAHSARGGDGDCRDRDRSDRRRDAEGRRDDRETLADDHEDGDRDGREPAGRQRRAASPSRPQRRSRSRSPRSHGHRRHRDAVERSLGQDRDDRLRAREGKGAEEPRAGYGLQDGHLPEYVREGRRDDAELTRKALAERAEEREREREEVRARAAAARKKHRVGALSAEEREARRAAMAEAAADLGGQRLRMLQRVHEEDTAVISAERKDTEEYLRSEEKRTLLASRAINI